MTDTMTVADETDIVERLRDAGSCVFFEASAPDLQCEAADEIERLRDSNEGLTCDLRMAVQTAYNRGATEWARLNYPQWIEWLESSAP